MSKVESFEDFLAGIDRLGGSVSLDTESRALIGRVVDDLTSAGGGVTHNHLVSLIRDHPEYIPILGLCVQQSQEQMRNLLRHWFGTPSWNRVAETRSKDLVARLDSEFGIVGEINSQLSADFTFADILAERYSSRLRAAGSIQRGRSLEDSVERVVDGLGLHREMRTKFSGRSSQTAPCDLAIPRGGTEALIVCGIKGFDSTGSKLTDAAREIQQMAEVRLPSQYVFAVVDGLGWLRRRADLKRIHDLFSNRSIDGIYTKQMLPEFGRDLKDAALRVGILR